MLAINIARWSKAIASPIQLHNLQPVDLCRLWKLSLHCIHRIHLPYYIFELRIFPTLNSMATLLGRGLLKTRINLRRIYFMKCDLRCRADLWVCQCYTSSSLESLQNLESRHQSWEQPKILPWKPNVHQMRRMSRLYAWWLPIASP
jgi:hypothetical protein